MQTLRVKLTVPAGGGDPGARETFEEIADVHSDQAIFQVNRSRYVDEETWGFRVEHGAKRDAGFVRTTSPAAVERTMAEVAFGSFERRLDDG